MTYDENIKYIATEFAKSESKNWVYDSQRYRSEAIERKIPLAVLSISFQAKAYENGYADGNTTNDLTFGLKIDEQKKQLGLIP
jgi:hypothetical protein